MRSVRADISERIKWFFVNNYTSPYSVIDLPQLRKNEIQNVDFFIFKNRELIVGEMGQAIFTSTSNTQASEEQRDPVGELSFSSLSVISSGTFSAGTTFCIGINICIIFTKN